MEYPYSCVTRQIGNTEIELIGVYHDLYFFNQLQDFFEKKIESSPEGIILEQPDDCEFWEEPFFAKLGEIAYENQIPIYQADPININFQQNALESALLESMLGEYESIFHEDTTAYHLYARWSSTHKPKILFDFLDQMDWRDVKITEGIEKIVEKEHLKKLIAFHGADHTKPISFYLDHLLERQLKTKMYLKFEESGRKGVRKYLPTKNPESEEDYQLWELAETF